LTITQSTINRVLRDASEEAIRKEHKHGRIVSRHELCGLLDEELYEFKLEAFRKTKNVDLDAMRDELVQVIALCLRGISSLCEQQEKQ
jgi:hypothetical protein